MSSNIHNFRNLAFCLIVPPAFCIIAQQTGPVSRARGKFGPLAYLSLGTCFWWLSISPEEVLYLLSPLQMWGYQAAKSTVTTHLKSRKVEPGVVAGKVLFHSKVCFFSQW